MHEITTFIAAHPLEAVAFALVLGWLIRRRWPEWPHFGGKASAPKPESINQASAPAAPTHADVLQMVRREVSAATAPDNQAPPAALSAAHVLLDTARDHPDQLDALAPVITALTKKAATA